MIVRMYRFAIIGVFSVAISIGLNAVQGPGTLAAEDRSTGIEIELTESFYRALRAEGAKTYSTDKSEEYLRQIAVSSRFSVESNLKILKQQERIIVLLEKLNQHNKN